MKSFIVVVSTVALFTLGTVATAVETKDDALANLKRQLYAKLRGADPNSTDKYHIDLYFSPVHGMRAYTELLRWSQKPEVPQSKAEELQSIVSMGLLAVYGESGAGVPMGGQAEPISVVFDYSLPRYTRPLTDHHNGTTHWNPLNMKRQTGAAGIGQSLAAKSLWLRTMGGKGADVILPSLLGELEVVTAPPFSNPSGSGLVPEEVEWNEGKWHVKKSFSRLRSQASLLIGLLETKKFLDTPGALETEIANIERLRVTVNEAIADLFRGIIEKHRDPDTKALVGIFDNANGRGDRILIEDLGLAAEALGSLARTGEGDIAKVALRVLREQADFVMRALPEGGLAPRGWFVPTVAPWRGTITTLSEQMAALMVLVEASNSLGENRSYLDAANRLHANMEGPLWVESAGVYRSAIGFKMSSYDGYLFGTVLGLLRRAERTGIFDQIDGNEYLDTVLISAGLLQAEGPQTGEPESPEALVDRELDGLYAELLELESETARRDRIQEFISGVIDQDGDTVPGIRFGGDVYGGAPVLVNQVGIRTPYTPTKTAEEVRGAER